jgi:hypothetical protein
MTRFLLAAGAAALLVAAPVRGLADDAATSAAPSAPAAPDHAGGCMPGGQCCGGGSCKAAEGDAAGSEGGCPCKRRQALQEKAAKLREAEQQQSAPANP